MPVIYNTFVPNQIPDKPFNILCIGESPGEEEEAEGRPFIGPAGQLLAEVFLRFGIDIYTDVGLCNLSNYRPQNNQFTFLFKTPQLEQGIQSVKKIIEERKPNVIATLGQYPTLYLTEKSGISRYRGSILKGFAERKYIPTFHPSYITRDRSKYPLFAADVKRIVFDSASPNLNYTPRNFHIVEDEYGAYEWASKLQQYSRLSVDIESVKKTGEILCVGFSDSKNNSVCFIWNLFTKPLIEKILTSPAEKIFHFGTFDVQKLYQNGIIVNNYKHDTFAMQHVLEPELPKSLDFLTSILTREPYYKQEGRGEIPEDTKIWSEKVNKKDLYIYNNKDTAVTFEIAEELLCDLIVDPDLQNIYEHEMEMTQIALVISREGMLVDMERRELFRKSLLHDWNTKQYFLNSLAKKYINVNGKQTLYDYLYVDLKLPVKRNHDGGITADEDAIVALITHVTSYLSSLKRQSSITEWNVKLEVLKLILEIRGLRKMLSSYINSKVSADNRARSTYKLSPETGRWAAEKFVDQTGFNAQTMPRGYVQIPNDVDKPIDFSTLISQLNEEENDS
jgi:uracil-DNA glycosylase family 4